MKTLKLTSISDIKTEKARIDNKVSRKYYTAYFMDASNPFAKPVQRNIFEQHNADGTAVSWKGGDPAIVKTFVGKEIPGQIVNCEVEPYEIEGRTVTSYTVALLDGENLKSILKQQGHAQIVRSADDKTVTEVGATFALNGK